MAPGSGLPSVGDMTKLSKTFIVLSLTCGAAWLVKQVVIVASGGGDAENAGIAALWATGMITFVLAAGTGVALLLAGRRAWVRVLAGIAAAPAAFLVLQVLDGVVDSVYTADGWFAQEVPLVLAALVMGALGVRVLGDRREVG
jgi:hypothetical protein